jgi:hypothetical protein
VYVGVYVYVGVNVAGWKGVNETVGVGVSVGVLVAVGVGVMVLVSGVRLSVAEGSKVVREVKVTAAVTVGVIRVSGATERKKIPTQ